VASTQKPRRRSGYTHEQTALVESACLSVAATLGALMDDLCIVGGLVPTLLLDRRAETREERSDRHPGTVDLDVGLGLALLDGHRYAEVSDRLRREGFEPDTNENGNATLQRWRFGTLGATVDFLLPTIPGGAGPGRIHPLEADFGALVAPGLELAFEERIHIPCEGRTLRGEQTRRDIPVCGPAAFVVLKALAFADRAEPKDAFDLVYVIRHWPGGAPAIAERLVRHSRSHRNVVLHALHVLARDFATPETLGPARVAEFEQASGRMLRELAADAHGDVADLLALCRLRDLP
jgi:hypothetical protein